MRRPYTQSRCVRARQADAPRAICFDTLEPRVLLAASPALTAASPALTAGGVKLTESATRVSAKLLQLYDAVIRKGVSPTAAAANDRLAIDGQGRAGVTVRAKNVGATSNALRAVGFQPTASFPKLHFVEGLLPIASIRAVGTIGKNLGKFAVRPNYVPVTLAGSVQSQGDFVLEAGRVRAMLPGAFDGSGVKVGVLSDSFNRLGGAAADIASGDLPAAGVQVVAEGPVAPTLRDEGRAMLQLVHDLAPGAALAFATGAGSQGTFANNIRALAAPAVGATVIVDDVLHFGEPMFQDGVIAQAIDEVVTTRGVTFFSAAGNHASQAYESSAFTTASDTVSYGPGLLVPGAYYDFNPSPAIDTRQRITVPANGRIAIELQWDDPFYTLGGVDTDLDIYLVNPDTGRIVSGSESDNRDVQEPFEVLGYINSSAAPVHLAVAIRQVAGPSPGRIKYVNYGESAITFDEFATNGPTVVPHAAAANARAVGAVPYYDPAVPEPFTSAGPGTVLFSPTGVRLTSPQVRDAPQLAASDGVNNTFFGNRDVEGDGLPNFFGTSAAAAHAAAVAALVRQANPSFSPADVYVRLEQTAHDIAAPGFDALTGHGLVNAYDAVYPGPPPVTAVFVAGTAWTPAYRDHLQNAGEGESRFGYRINPAEQSRTLGWANLNQLSLRFSGPADIEAGELRINGVNVPSYALAPTAALTYDPATFTATWTLGRIISNDKLTLTLAGEVVFSFRVLPGDVNRDNAVNVFDYNALRPNLNQLGKGVTGGDLNGDNLVDIVDFNLYRTHLNKTAPR